MSSLPTLYLMVKNQRPESRTSLRRRSYSMANAQCDGTVISLLTDFQVDERPTANNNSTVPLGHINRLATELRLQIYTNVIQSTLQTARPRWPQQMDPHLLCRHLLALSHVCRSFRREVQDILKRLVTDEWSMYDILAPLPEHVDWKVYPDFGMAVRESWDYSMRLFHFGRDIVGGKIFEDYLAALQARVAR
ncbi:hypothetical protein B0A48_16796 [Cryoendolithus antarcticus]|uniref:F-box domain-containing protein n=1 Tax=Cryoendolithus antarcticus TaxID=1507870 RepID=A0A1V8SDJ6_9PEZI|nr:hypothetical protein B0A48_16796 [Cryoendolithus antarcticus]